MEPSQDLDPQAVQRAAERLWRQRWPEKVGRRHGATWALEVASYSDIMWVLGLREEVGTLVERIEQERPGFTQGVADKPQAALRDNTRIKKLERTGGRITRVGEGRLINLLPVAINTGEFRIRHKNFAPNLEHIGHERGPRNE